MDLIQNLDRGDPKKKISKTSSTKIKNITLESKVKTVVSKASRTFQICDPDPEQSDTIFISVWIRIQHFRLNTDPDHDPTRIQGF